MWVNIDLPGWLANNHSDFRVVNNQRSLRESWFVPVSQVGTLPFY